MIRLKKSYCPKYKKSPKRKHKVKEKRAPKIYFRKDCIFVPSNKNLWTQKPKILLTRTPMIAR